MTVKLLLVKSENGLETRQDYDGLSANNPTFTGVLTGASAALTGDVDAGGEIKSGALAGAGARPLVALADGTLDDQDAATFRGTIGALAADNPGFTGALKQGGTTRITSGGGAWLASVQSANLLGAGDRPVAADLTGTLQPKTPDQFRNMIFALASSLKGAANGVAELGADGKVPVAQLPSSPIVSVAKTMEFALANEVTTNPVQILTVPVPAGFFTTNGLIELDLDLDLLYFASGNRMTLNFEVGVRPMWFDWIDDIPADAPRVFHGYIGKYKEESGETYVRMIGTLNGVRVSGEYHDVTSTVAIQTSFRVAGHVGIEGVGAHVNCAVAKVFA